MGYRFIRQPSDAPTVSNRDDARLFRYALGDYNGYIKNYRSELSYTINGLDFTINSGVVVLQGYETEIDSSGATINLIYSPTRHYYVVYYEVNLATQTTKIDSVYDTVGDPTLTHTEDLTANTDGISQMELYRFYVQSGVVYSVSKIVQPIGYAAKSLMIPEDTIPNSRVLTVSSLNGNYETVVQSSGSLAPGWYEVVLSGGAGGGNGYIGTTPAAGSDGGYLKTRFFVPHVVFFKISAGGGGRKGTNGGGMSLNSGRAGGGGGGSTLEIPQLGILLIASGGGGACALGEVSDGEGRILIGGGGGGQGGGGQGGGRTYLTGGEGGAGGGEKGGDDDESYGDTQDYKPGHIFGNGSGAGGGAGGDNGGKGGGIGGNGGTWSNIWGSPGGNNLNTTLGGGGVCENGNSHGGNGSANLYRLG